MSYKFVSILNKILNKFTPFVITSKSNLDNNVKAYIDVFEKLDYNRVMTFNLIVSEIYYKKLGGNVAELGVYKGNFSKLINQSFPEKSIYLFDTFQGFDESDFIVSEEKKIINTVLHDFDDTSVEKVMKIMSFPEKCIIRKGLFPSTSVGLENETYCFVSIDADLYKPIIDGLRYFYPRLIKGGYIMVHDYNNKQYKGAKKAVREFATENNISYLPLCDGWGSAVFTK